MDMVTDIANMEIRKTARIIILSSALTVFHAAAKDIDFGANASSDLTFSDNINASSSNEHSGFVSTWSAGANSNINGNDGSLSFDYDIYQTIHSINSDRNELFNELSLAADKNVYRDNIRFNIGASITNVARFREENANSDFISGDTVETRNVDVGLSYKSNRSGLFDIYAAINGGMTSNEDNIGDLYNYGSDLEFRNGSSVKKVFWLTDYTYNQNVYRNTEDEYYDFAFVQEVGLQRIKNISPLIRVYYEGYTDEEEELVESGSWGPALRYYWHNRSYIEVAYDFSFKDEDFWRGYLILNPTPRTLFEFDYTKKFYGDAYSFLFSHTSKKMTNTIEYSEELLGFDREFFVVGENIQEYKLVKGLTLSSTLNLKRTSFTLKARVSDRKPVSDLSGNRIGSSETYGASLTASHRLSSDTSLSGAFQYDKDKFDSSSKTNYYRNYDLSFNNNLSQHLSYNFSVNRANGSIYSENRANFTMRLTY